MNPTKTNTIKLITLVLIWLICLLASQPNGEVVETSNTLSDLSSGKVDQY